jgi:hypothetical protein
VISRGSLQELAVSGSWYGVVQILPTTKPPRTLVRRSFINHVKYYAISLLAPCHSPFHMWSPLGKQRWPSESGTSRTPPLPAFLLSPWVIFVSISMTGFRSQTQDKNKPLFTYTYTNLVIKVQCNNIRLGEKILRRQWPCKYRCYRKSLSEGSVWMLRFTWDVLCCYWRLLFKKYVQCARKVVGEPKNCTRDQIVCGSCYQERHHCINVRPWLSVTPY